MEIQRKMEKHPLTPKGNIYFSGDRAYRIPMVGSIFYKYFDQAENTNLLITKI